MTNGKMCWLVVLMVLAVSLEGQPRQYVLPELNVFPPLAKRAAVNLFEMRWEESCRDTAVLCYIRQSLWFQWDSMQVQFSVDSITGRGDGRKVLVVRRIYLQDANVDSMTASRWLSYTRKVSSPEYGWYVPSDSLSIAGALSMVNGNRTLRVWLEKVIGDPTKNYGFEQRAFLHFLWRENTPVWWRTFADSIRALP